MKDNLTKTAFRYGVSRRLRAFRSIYELTQQNIANKTGMSKSLYALIENGIQDPSFNFIIKMSRSYNISANWLLFGLGDMTMDKNESKRIDDLLRKMISKNILSNKEKRDPKIIRFEKFISHADKNDVNALMKIIDSLDVKYNDEQSEF